MVMIVSYPGLLFAFIVPGSCGPAVIGEEQERGSPRPAELPRHPLSAQREQVKREGRRDKREQEDGRKDTEDDFGPCTMGK